MNITSNADLPAKVSSEISFPVTTSRSLNRGALVPSASIVDRVSTMPRSSFRQYHPGFCEKIQNGPSACPLPGRRVSQKPRHHRCRRGFLHGLGKYTSFTTKDTEFTVNL